MHYSVIVVGENIDKQLEPFNSDCDPYDSKTAKYLEFTTYNDTETAEVIQGFVDDIKSGDIEGNNIFKYAKETLGYVVNDEDLITEPPEYYTKKAFSIHTKYKGKVPDGVSLEGIKFGYLSNPKSFWDWYQIGGRYTSRLKLKKGKQGTTGSTGVKWMMPFETLDRHKKEEYCDCAKIGDIDWEAMEKEHYEEIERRYTKFIRAYMKSKKIKTSVFTEGGFPEDFNPYGEYGVSSVEESRFVPPTKEQFIKKRPFIYSYGILCDGVYYHREDTHYKDTYEQLTQNAQDWAHKTKEIFKNLDPDTIITVVDCHD